MRCPAAIMLIAPLIACNVYDAFPADGNPNGGSSGGSTAGTTGGGRSPGLGGSTAGANTGGVGANGGAGAPTGGGAAGSTTGGGMAGAGMAGADAAGGVGLAGAGGIGADSSIDNSSGGFDSGREVDALADAAPLDGSTDADAREADAGAGNCAGFAFNFTGATHAALPRPVQDDFTLEAWIKTSSSLTGTRHFEGRGIFYADYALTANDFGSSILNNRFAFGVGNPDTTVQSAISVATNQWVHVAATRRRSTGQIQVVVNGTLDGSLTPAQTSSLTAQVTMAVGGNFPDSRYFIGYMDEVRIWNIVRTPAEILSTMSQRLNGNETGLVSYFRFDEGSGQLAVDSSSRGVDATLNGSPAWVPSDAPVCGLTAEQ